MSEEATPDPTPSSGRITRPQRRMFDNRKPKKMSMKQECKPMCLKGVTPELKGKYFLTLEDDPRNKQDSFRTT